MENYKDQPDDGELLFKWGPEIQTMLDMLDDAIKTLDEQDDFTLNIEAKNEDEAVWIFERINDRTNAFYRHSNHLQDVYFYATDCILAKDRHALKIGYAKLLEAGKTAYVGRWTDRGITYIDPGTAVDDGMDDDGIRKILRCYKQRAATKLEATNNKGNKVEVDYHYVYAKRKG